jgi:hypothetical protein
MQRGQLEFEVHWQLDSIGKISGDSCKISHKPKAVDQTPLVNILVSKDKFSYKQHKLPWI